MLSCTNHEFLILKYMNVKKIWIWQENYRYDLSDLLVKFIDI